MSPSYHSTTSFGLKSSVIFFPCLHWKMSLNSKLIVFIETYQFCNIYVSWLINVIHGNWFLIHFQQFHYNHHHEEVWYIEHDVLLHAFYIYCHWMDYDIHRNENMSKEATIIGRKSLIWEIIKCILVLSTKYINLDHMLQISLLISIYTIMIMINVKSAHYCPF